MPPFHHHRPYIPPPRPYIPPHRPHIPPPRPPMHRPHFPPPGPNSGGSGEGPSGLVGLVIFLLALVLMAWFFFGFWLPGYMSIRKKQAEFQREWEQKKIEHEQFQKEFDEKWEEWPE